MYVPDTFRESHLQTLHELMHAWPFATLLTLEEGLPVANHLPLLLRPSDSAHGTLVGHVARANPVWRTLQAGPGLATAIFQGPAAYVSPSWYPAKARHHKVVPTWNYAIVHAHGPVRIVEEADWLQQLIRDLTDRHEVTSTTPWQVADAPEDFITAMIGQIVGLELTITRLTGKWKLSQNRPAEDVAGVIEGLRARDLGTDQALAEMMSQGMSAEV